MALNVGRVVEERTDAAAYMIACYSQPGVDIARSLTKRPVYDIQNAGVLSALAAADSFGVVAVSVLSIPRHLRQLRRLGVSASRAGLPARSRSKRCRLYATWRYSPDRTTAAEI